MFDTYGPFTLTTHDDAGIEHLFDEQIKKDETRDIELGFGVYVIAAKDSDGGLVPWYVGRTHREFGKRILQHFKSGRFRELAQRGPLNFFLLARARDGVVFKSSEARSEGSTRAVNYFEVMLIGTCIRLNAELLNKREKRFHLNLHVPGYRRWTIRPQVFCSSGI